MFKNIINIFLFLSIIIFFLTIYKYYSSNTNVEARNYNRLNIDEILEEKISNLPVLANDTNDVIEFNDTFEKEITNEKKRSFWELLKNK